MTDAAEIPVLVTTQHRGVFAGLVPADHDMSLRAFPLCAAKMAIYWGTEHGGALDGYGYGYGYGYGGDA